MWVGDNIQCLPTTYYPPLASTVSHDVSRHDEGISHRSKRNFGLTSSDIERRSMTRLLSSAFIATSAFNNIRSFSSSTSSSALLRMSKVHPELLVYDLDACLWDKEMFEMSHMPSRTVVGDLNGRGLGVTGVMSGRDKISLHEGSLISLQVR